jgi:hypothetical protein
MAARYTHATGECAKLSKRAAATLLKWTWGGGALVLKQLIFEIPHETV